MPLAAAVSLQDVQVRLYIPWRTSERQRLPRNREGAGGWGGGVWDKLRAVYKRQLRDVYKRQFPRMVERIAARERERVAAHQAANAAAGRPGDPIPPKTPEEKAEDERDSQASTDSMFDMVDGELVKEALRKDPAFAADPRNLLVVLVSDPFIVSA